MQAQIIIWDYIPMLSSFVAGSSFTALIVYLLKGLINNSINRAFLQHNTEIVQEVQTEFAKALGDYKYSLDEKLISYKQHTDEELARQIEPFKASLSKANIAFQITHTEYIKRQFTHVESLFSEILKMQRFVLKTYGISNRYTKESLEGVKQETYEMIRVLSDELHITAFYLPDDTIEGLFKYNQEVTTLIEHYEAYHESVLDLRNVVAGTEAHTQAVENIDFDMKSVRTQKQVIRDHFGILAKSLRKLTSASTNTNQ